MKIRTALGVGLAIAVASPASAATNLLANGSFESGFSAWTVAQAGGGTAPVVIPYGSGSGYPTGAFGEAILPNTVATLSPDPVGTSVAYFSSDTANPHSLSQFINLVSGTVYNIGFDYYAPENGISNPFDASLSFLVGGVPVGSTLVAGQPSGTPAKTWLNFGTSFTATASGPAELQFQFKGLGVTAADFAIDRVYVTAAVPEPSTWALMLLGFGAVGGAMRMKRRKASAALSFA